MKINPSNFNKELLLESIETCDEIIFEPGNYFFESGIKLENITKPITIKAMEGARFIGGKPVTGEITIRDNVCCMDLNCETGEIVSRGFGRPMSVSHSEIFTDGKPLNLSRYPKQGFLKIKDFVEAMTNEWSEQVGKLEKGFYYDSEQPKKWSDAEDILVHGYWSWDWANSYEIIDEFDKDLCKITTKHPHGLYAFKPGQRFTFHNILEEVTEPGDYYIDRANKKLFFIPFSEIPNEILISTLREPLWNIINCSNLTFDGFNIEATCGSGIVVSNCENISIANCDIKNIGNYAVQINNCLDVTVENCTIHDCGDGGISVSCGNRMTLEPGNCKISNNHIYRIAKWVRTYQTAVNASGVGIEITNNLIHDCPHTGILFWGNDIIVRNNEIYSALLETGDAGAVYTGRDYTFRGNVVSGNHIHHLGGVGMGTMGIYNDDCVSGTVMEDNIFCEVQRAVFLGGGRNFQVRRNLFVDCHPSIEIDGRGTSNHKVWRDMVDKLMRERYYAVNASSEPYISRYPELAEIEDFYNKNLPIPPSAVIENNIFCSHRKIEFTWEWEPGEFEIRSNKSVGRDYFKDCAIGWYNDEMFAIGLDESKRRSNPPRVLTGLTFDGENLIYRYKNFSNCAINAKIMFYSEDSDTPILLKCVIQANAENTIPIPFNKRKTTFDARADVAGIRPCRIKI